MRISFPSFLMALTGTSVGAMFATIIFPPPKTQSASLVEQGHAIPLPARGTYSKDQHRIFHFQPLQEGGVLLHYVPGGLIHSNEVVIQLNETPIGFVPSSGRGWGKEERLRIQKEQLKEGINHISFLPRKGRSIKKPWGVRDLYITPISADRRPGEDEGALFSSAERLFREGGSSLAQLARAEELIQKAIDAFGLQNRPIPKGALDLKRRIVEAERLLYARRISEGKKAARLGKAWRAETIYRKLLSELSDPADSRRVEVESVLEGLRP